MILYDIAYVNMLYKLFKATANVSNFIMEIFLNTDTIIC